MEITEYYKHLSRVQNAPMNAHVDIMTITGFMTKQEKLKHIENYAALDNDKRALKFVSENK